MRREFDISRAVEEFSYRIKDFLDQLENSASAPKRPAASSPEGERGGPRSVPKVDLSADLDGYYLDVDLPGLKREDIRLNVIGDRSLEITARWNRHEGGEREVIIQERPVGQLRRVVDLPADANVAFDQADAAFNEGVLHIRLPRKGGAESGRGIEIH